MAVEAFSCYALSMRFILAIVIWIAAATLASVVVGALTGFNLALLYGTPAGGVISVVAVILIWRNVTRKKKPVLVGPLAERLPPAA